MIYKLFLASIFLFFSWSHNLFSQDKILNGRVFDARNKLGIPGVLCCIDTNCVVTDYNGRFIIRNSVPDSRIAFTHCNYQTAVYTITTDNYMYELEVSLVHNLQPDSCSQPVYYHFPVDSFKLHIVDSINRAKSLANDLMVMEALIAGNIYVKFLSIDYRKIISYDQYQGFRLGLGLYTNSKVSSYFSLGGYFSYGTKDKDWKYGASLQLFNKWQSDTKIGLKYKNDVDEIGSYSFLDENSLNQSEFFRNVLVNQMYRTQEFEVDLGFKPFEYLKFNLFLNKAEKDVHTYYFLPSVQDFDGYDSKFNITEAGVNVKFSFKENLIRTPGGKLLSLGTSYPVLWFNFKSGIDLFSGRFLYNKYEVKISQKVVNKTFGQTEIVGVGGMVKGEVPICNLYNGHASYDRLFFDVENSFTTMRINEFKTSEFLSLFMRQNMGSIFINKKYFHPELTLVTNLGYGRLNNSFEHLPQLLNDYRKGYVESGILLGKLLDSGGLISYGFGVYYRYGYYSFKKITDNFAYKVTVNFRLRK